MDMSQRRTHAIENGVDASPGRNSHAVQATVDRHQATVPKKSKRSKMRIATWNIRTMYKTGKKENVENEMGRLNVNVLGLSEVRWPVVGCLETRTGGRFIYSGDQTNERGVGVMLDKMMKKYLIGYYLIV